MKKRISFILCCAAGMLMACGGGNQPAETTSQQPSATSEPAQTSTPATTSDVPAISVSEYQPTPAETSEEEKTNDEPYDYDSIRVNKPKVAPVDDFAYGADLSAVAEVEAAGGVYYNEEGKQEDVFKILARNGVNYCRLRLWNDPYSDVAKDAAGNRLSYGGGQNDLATDIYLAKRAKAAGMKILLDFHYSDHWADPSKFHAPKEWAGEFISDMPELLGNYTAGALKAFKNAGVTIDSVQIGNEENTGLAGFKFADAAEGIGDMVKAGVLAAKSVFPDIKTLVHLTNIKSHKSVMNFLNQMQLSEVPYDVVGLSYYPFWHGEQTNLTWMMEYIKDTYNKPTWVVETSYGYTDEAAEWASNQYGSHLENAGGYLTSIQGQTTAISDIISTITSAKENCGQGIFYWEPAWLPMEGTTWATPAGQYYNEHGKDAPASFDLDAAYPPKSCRSAWANQGWFSFTGKVLPSAATYKYVASGEKACEEVVIGPRDTEIEVTVNLREGVKLPTTAKVTTNLDALRSADIVWNAEEVAAIDKDGTYAVKGKVDGQFDIEATVIAQTNWIADYSFEEQAEGEQVAVRAPWEVTTQVASGARIEAKSEGNLDGSKYFHWYCASENTWELRQKLENVLPGDYDLSVRMMAGELKSDYKVFNIWYQIEGQERVNVDILNEVKGYGSPLNKYMTRPCIEHIILTAEKTNITIGLYCEAGPQAWGHADLFSFSAHQEQEAPDENLGFELENSIGAKLGWVIDENSGAMSVVDNTGNNAVGSPSTCATEVHFWSDIAYNFSMHKTHESLEAGSYTFSFLINADTPSNFSKFELYYTIGNSNETIIDLKPKMNPSGWASTATLVTVDGIVLEDASSFTIGFRVDGKANSWGHFTDILFTK